MGDQAISQTAIEFSRHVKQHPTWKEVTRIPKDDLRHYYTEQYKPAYKQDNPGNNIVNFAGLFRELRKQRLVQVYMVNGAKTVKIRAAKPTVAQNIANSSASQSPSKSRGSPSAMPPTASQSEGNLQDGVAKSKGKRQRRRARAVDQYITMRGGDPVEVIYEQSKEAGDQGLPHGIVTTQKGYRCTLCKVPVNGYASLQQHLKGNKHRLQILLNALKDKKSRFQCHSYVDVKSEYDHEGGSIRLDDLKPKTKKMIIITIKNTSPDQMLTLTGYKLIKRNKVFSFDDEKKVCNRGTVVKLDPGETYEVHMTASPRNVNRYHACVAFVFENEEEGTVIQIVRYLSAICTYPQVTQQFGPSAPFRRPPRVTLSRPKGKIEEGFPPERDLTEELEKEEPLEAYPVANWMRRLVNMGLKDSSQLSQEESIQLRKIKTLLQTDMTLKCHKTLFDLLLHLEEIQMEVDIRKYDMEDATLDYVGHNKRLLSLQVPGLAENRPSILKGDHLFVKIKGENEDVEYKGYVHAVECEQVHLGFGQKLMDKFIKGMKFNVRFTFNRLAMRLMHRAVKLAEEHSLDDVLFPTPFVVGSQGTIQPVDTKMRLFDRKLEDNQEQAMAVHHIVSGTSRRAPYILFGPPGTGKTVTMVESIKQVLHCIPTSCILACAPSNSAADLLCQRIITHVGKDKVFRMNAMSRQCDTIPEDIKACCNYRGGRCYFPKKEILQQYKVIITTLITAGRIASANFPAGHFSHVFIDECGHATEPETMIALAGILESDINKPDGGQVVFAGDPEQLGPVLRSPVAIKHGLGQSMLERLMKNCEVYCRNDESSPPYDARLITKLVRNYRSHPDILEQSNKMFYHGELKFWADKLERESLCQWDALQKKGFPIMFHGVVGKDQREERSPSFFNPEECWTVMEYIDKLLNARGITKLKPKHIGVISPYRRQVQKLKTAIKKKNLTELKVGSVEEFQGQERKVIIISTVRSSEEFLPLDSQFKLGFLRNPKRFNVAVTRAKALLIVVGNPYLLRVDEHWNQLLQYVIQKGGYTGCDMDVEKEEVLDIIERLAAVKLDTVDEPHVSSVTEQEEPEWKVEN